MAERPPEKYPPERAADAAPLERVAKRGWFFADGWLLPTSLFLLTFLTATIAGAEWTLNGAALLDPTKWATGLPFSISLMFILASHEFGHYFAARAHGVEASLPRFLPFPPLLGTVGLPNFGTLGAVIKTKTEVASRRALFDVGAAGPIAGFVATLIVLAYGFTHLPSVEFLLDIHPDYFADDYLAEGAALTFGDSLLFAGMRAVLPSATDFVPPMTEVYHYPFLNAGWFGLFITAMNLIPVGQLDGGHIAAARLGRRGHIKVAAFSMIALVAMGAAGAITALGSDYGWFDYQFGWGGWLFWAGLLYFFVRVEHPPLAEEEPLDPKRRAVAYLALAIFALSFAPSPLYIAPTG